MTSLNGNAKPGTLVKAAAVALLVQLPAGLVLFAWAGLDYMDTGRLTWSNAAGFVAFFTGLPALAFLARLMLDERRAKAPKLT